MKSTRKRVGVTGAKTDMVQRLVRLPAGDDEWLEEKARKLAESRGRATVQDCVREIIRQARETEAATA